MKHTESGIAKSHSEIRGEEDKFYMLLGQPGGAGLKELKIPVSRY